MESLPDKNKIEIYSARYTPVNGKEPTWLSTLQLHLLGQQIGKIKIPMMSQEFKKKEKKRQVISSVAPVLDFRIIMQKLQVFFNDVSKGPAPSTQREPNPHYKPQ